MINNDEYLNEQRRGMDSVRVSKTRLRAIIWNVAYGSVKAMIEEYPDIESVFGANSAYLVLKYADELEAKVLDYINFNNTLYEDDENYRYDIDFVNNLMYISWVNRYKKGVIMEALESND